jgi:hypothetical protein
MESTDIRLPLPEAARRLEIRLPVLLTLLKKRRLPCVRVAGSLYVMENEVRAYFDTLGPNVAVDGAELPAHE